MKLAIPFTWAGEVWSEVEFRKPSAEVMADSREALESGDYFSALLTFLAGVTKSITSESGKAETDSGQIRNALKEMPAGNADHVALFCLAQGGNDAIEGYYHCPRCRKPMICEGDNADSILHLEVRYCEKDPIIEVTMTDPVVISNKATGDVLMSVENITLRHPTMRDYMQAFTLSGKDSVRQQYFAYVNALLKVNGKPLQPDFQRKYGWAFGKMNLVDMNEIAKQLLAVGLQRTVTKKCGQCGKEWEATVSTSGFFGSALEGQ